MKRTITILLMCILCIIFVGCNREEKKSQLVKLDKTTNNDVENILTFCNSGCELITFDMDDKIRTIKNENCSFYMCEIDEEQYDIICAYIDVNKYETEYNCERFQDYDYYSNATWYKFDNKDSIKNNIDGLKLAGVFIAYDAIITYDVINEKECNYKCKYYEKIDEHTGGLYIIPNKFKLKYNNLILWESKELIESNDYFFYKYIFNLGYEIRYDSKGVKRVVFDNVSYISDGEEKKYISSLFGESYQYFSKWLIDEQDFEQINQSTHYLECYVIRKKVSISLEKFVELIKEITLNGE